MTYEEQILMMADIKCRKIYVTEIACSLIGLILVLLYIFFKNDVFIITALVSFSAGLVFEMILCSIEKKAKTYVDKRLLYLNKSLQKTISRFQRDNLRKEISDFEKEYYFLKKE